MTQQCTPADGGPQLGIAAHRTKVRQEDGYEFGASLVYRVRSTKVILVFGSGPGQPGHEVTETLIYVFFHTCTWLDPSLQQYPVYECTVGSSLARGCVFQLLFCRQSSTSEAGFASRTHGAPPCSPLPHSCPGATLVSLNLNQKPVFSSVT